MESLNTIGKILIAIVSLLVISLVVLHFVYFNDEKYDSYDYSEDIEEHYEEKKFDINDAFAFAQDSPACVDFEIDINNYEYDDKIKSWRFKVNDKEEQEDSGVCAKYCVVEEISKMSRLDKKCSGSLTDQQYSSTDEFTHDSQVEILTIKAESIERIYPDSASVVYGYVRDINDFGIPDIEVVIGDQGNSTKSEEDGYFVIDTVNPGEWQLSALMDPVRSRRYLMKDSIKIQINDLKPTRQDIIFNLK